MKLLLYKGKGSIGNRLVRWWKRSPYSHCEIQVGNLCYSSSIMDHGVRAKYIKINHEHWDEIDIAWANDSDVMEYFRRTEGQPYSWKSLIWSQFFNREYDEDKASFCSEWCAAALKIPNPHTYSPQGLGDLCKLLSIIKVPKS